MGARFDSAAEVKDALKALGEAVELAKNAERELSRLLRGAGYAK